jgi:hypothetical protein
LTRISSFFRKTMYVFLLSMSSILLSQTLHAQQVFFRLPLIEQLSFPDPLFKQLSADMTQARQALAAGKELPTLLFFRYKVRENEDIFTIAARLTVDIETIAVLNGLRSPDELVPGMDILLSNLPGLFIAQEPENDFEELLFFFFNSQFPQISNGLTVPTLDQVKKVYFLPGIKVNPTIRAFFLQTAFIMPLKNGQISSRFGTRLSPFTGKPSFHGGLDIAAPEGTEVLASRAGIVHNTGWNSILGNFIILSHDGGIETVYGHLQRYIVPKGTRVGSGDVIGYVGSTGLSTGPHLHFEIVSNGENRDPLLFLPRNTE